MSIKFLGGGLYTFNEAYFCFVLASLLLLLFFPVIDIIVVSVLFGSLFGFFLARVKSFKNF